MDLSALREQAQFQKRNRGLAARKKNRLIGFLDFRISGIEVIHP